MKFTTHKQKLRKILTIGSITYAEDYRQYRYRTFPGRGGDKKPTYQSAYPRLRTLVAIVYKTLKDRRMI